MSGTTIDPEHDENPDLLGVYVNVLPDHRRRGVGWSLLAEVVELARREGRTRLIADTTGRVPAGEAFAKRLGATPKLATHMNHLPTADVDRATMEQWVAEGPHRAARYELIGFDGSCPDELLDAYASLANVMNTAPRDHLEIQDSIATPETTREHERRAQAVGYEQWALIARHVASGELVGFHTVGWIPTNPKVVWVGDTGVQPAHRGHALGKWLKAVMTLRVLDERPDVVEIRTGNADSNDAMLGINKAMSYRPMIAETVWEIAVADAAQRLAMRGIAVGPSPA